jgi:hypothetical protein
MTLNALASRGDATRRRAVQRMLRLEEMIDMLKNRLWVVVDNDLYRQWHHADHLYTYMSSLLLHRTRQPSEYRYDG